MRDFAALDRIDPLPLSFRRPPAALEVDPLYALLKPAEGWVDYEVGDPLPPLGVDIMVRVDGGAPIVTVLMEHVDGWFRHGFIRAYRIVGEQHA